MSAKKKSGNGEWKIVIAEDSPTQAEQLKHILETHGYQVVAANNGREALAFLRSNKPNLVISDIVMPEMDGYELCKQIKIDEKFKDIPVILLTALSDPDDVIRGLECGADNFLTKPYDERVLFSRIEYLRLNWRLPESQQVQMGVEITFGGQKYFITSDRLQILNLLLSTYESAVGKNRELEQAQAELRRLNEQLEQRVKARTAELVKANEQLNQEIVRRKQADEAIRASEEKYRALVENATDLIFMIDEHDKILTLNKSAANLFRREPSNLIGKTIFDLFPKETAVQFSENLKQVFETGRTQTIEGKMPVGKDDLWISSSLSPVRGHKNEVVAVMGVTRNITEHKRAEERIVHLNSVLRVLRGVNQLITLEKDRERLIKQSCDLIVKTRGFLYAWILLLDEERKFVSATVNGGRETQAFYKQLKRGDYPPCVDKMLAYKDSLAICDDIVENRVGCLPKSYHNDGKAFINRLEYEGKVYGIVSLYTPSDFVIDPEEQSLFRELAGDIAFALFNIEKEEERKKAEEALKESEARFRTIYENAIDGMLVADLEQKIFCMTNKAMCQMLGCDQEEILNLGVMDIHPQDDLPYVIEQFEKQARGEISLAKDIPIKRKDGTVVYTDVNSVRVNLDGRECLLGMFRDISERRRAETTLQESEEKWRSLVENAPDIIMLIDRDRKIQFLNHVVAGLDAKDVIGRSIYDYIQPEHHQITEKTIGRVFKTGEPAGYVIEGIGPDGKSSWYETRIGAIKSNGEVTGIIQISSEITERKQLEQAIQKSRNSLLEAQQIAHVGSWDWDISKNMLSYSDEFQRIFGRPIHNFEMFLDSLHPDDRGFVEKSVNEALRGDRLYDIEYRITLPNREGRVIRAQGRVTFDNSGKPAQMVGTVQDITERKRMEDELRNHKEHLEEIVEERTTQLESSNRQLEQELAERQRIEEKLRIAIDNADAANRAKSDFLARMSHEIRTPIHGVLGTIDLVLGTKLNDEQQTYVNMSRHSAETLLNVIDDILDFSKIEAGKIEFKEERFDLREVIEDTLEAVSVKAHTKGLELYSLISGETPVTISGDAGRLKQVLVNLLGNAVKFTEQGEIGVSATLEKDDKEEVELHFSVCDTGIGIDSEQQKSLFQSFQQVDSSTTRKYGGTGLGLAICRQLVTLMNGQIWIASQLGKGSTFHFTARFKKACENKVPTLNRDTIPADSQKSSVLLVDDNASSRAMLRELLDSSGLKVVEAQDGKDALHELNISVSTSTPISMVFLDQKLAQEDGFDIAKVILNNTALNPAVIMMLLSTNISNDVARCYELSLSNYLVKPVKQRELMGIIMKAPGLTQEEVEDKRKTESSSAPLTELRILVAEDNITSQLIARKMLEKQGHKVTIASNGFQACQMLEKNEFDLVLMDVEMPEMNGLDATRSIRRKESGSGRHIPIIAMTAYAMKEDREKCLEAGMDDYLSKPVNLSEINNFIRALPRLKKEPDSKSFDLEAALKVVGGDEDILKEVISTFLEQDYPEQLRQLKEGIDKEDARTVKAEAHSIKGAARSFGGTNVSSIALRLEEMGRNNSLTGAKEALKELEHEVERFADCYAEVVNGHDKGQ